MINKNLQFQNSKSTLHTVFEFQRRNQEAFGGGHLHKLSH